MHDAVPKKPDLEGNQGPSKAQNPMQPGYDNHQSTVQLTSTCEQAHTVSSAIPVPNTQTRTASLICWFIIIFYSEFSAEKLTTLTTIFPIKYQPTV
jgi:hypothetical protein